MNEWPKTKWNHDKYSGWILNVQRSVHSNMIVSVHMGDTKEQAIRTLESALKQLQESPNDQ